MCNQLRQRTGGEMKKQENHRLTTAHQDDTQINVLLHCLINVAPQVPSLLLLRVNDGLSIALRPYHRQVCAVCNADTNVNLTKEGDR